MLDAVLFTANGVWSPLAGLLPPPVKAPVLRALREYRDDSALRDTAGPKGYVVGSVEADEEILYDWGPSLKQAMGRIRLWGAANQFVVGTFAIRVLESVEQLQIKLEELVGPRQAKIGSRRIDLRIVLVRFRRTDLFEQSAKFLVPELLLRDDRTGLPPKGRQGGFGGAKCVTRIPAHQSRQIWMTVEFPAGSPPGLYRGDLALEVPGAPHRRSVLPVEIELLPIDLRPAEGYYSIYYPSQPVDPKQPNYVSAERYLTAPRDGVPPAVALKRWPSSSSTTVAVSSRTSTILPGVT
jgi:hypothetical protein